MKYTIWEDVLAPDVKNYLSFSQDSGLTFSSQQPLVGMDDASISTSIFSQQLAFGDYWYWFVSSEPSTISVISAVIPNKISATDHYLAYDVKVETKHHKHHDDNKHKHHDDNKHKHHDHDSSKTDKKEVTLVDEFEGESKYQVKKLKKLLNPVNKNNEGIVNEESHLVEYKIKQLKGETKFKGIKEIPVFNQFGELTVDIKKVKTLLVPSAKDHDEEPNELEEITINHFKCYEAKESKHTPKFEKRNVNLDDQFGEVNMQVYKPKMLCSPVDKNNEGIVNEDAYLMCYDLKKIKGEPKFKKISVFTNDQFTSEKLKAEKQKRLCVPSTITGEEPEPVECVLPEILNPETGICEEPEPVECVLPEILNPETGICEEPEPLCDEGYTHNGEECVLDP